MKIGSKVKLSRVTSNHSYLRTSEVIGAVRKVPEVGSCFVMVAEPLESKWGFRYIETSIIQSLDECGDVWRIQTENSTYDIELLENENLPRDTLTFNAEGR